MGWRSRETMDTYIHTMGKREALLSLMLTDEQDIQGDGPQPLVEDQPPKGKVTTNTTAPGRQDEEDFSWYEE